MTVPDQTIGLDETGANLYLNFFSGIMIYQKMDQKELLVSAIQVKMYEQILATIFIMGL